MTLVPPPPAGLSCHIHELAAGTDLTRMHDMRFGGASFNPGYGRSRFAPFQDVDGKTVPTAYAGSTFACATFEYIFHDIDPAASFKTVPMSTLAGIGVSLLSLRRPIKLAALFEIDLNKLGLTRGQLIDTPPSTYGDTVDWARAIHGSSSAIDGIVWTSRKFDPDLALILFGDRVGAGDLELLASSRLTDDPVHLARVRELGNRAGITISV